MKQATQIKLAALGNPDAKPSRTLEKIPSGRTPEESLKITLNCTEFTCRCPITRQPDWATIEVVYRPDKWLVESKSMKLYLETFRDEGIFHEHLAQIILRDFQRMIEPVWCKVTANFNTRGGIAISAVASGHRSSEEDWNDRKSRRTL